MDARAWEQLLAMANPSLLLIAIDRRIGPALAARVSPDDVLQETLLIAWNDRARFTRGGPRAFREWLLTIAEHRIMGLADHFGAAKRGGGAGGVSLIESHDQAANTPASATPSRIAWHRERADALRLAFDALDEELREIVMLRIVEQRTLDEIAAHLGLSQSLVRRRLRRGAELLRYSLTGVLGSKTSTSS
ncbi:MAG: sigma-70 family RNA polymerase sigma factor [Planctomycetota bacterium]|nr:sigma-70 family RNA polymerase sigma factor [Planctomycetota bacterium]